MTYPLMSLLNKEKNMAIYRTAQGRPLDMGALVAKNEKTRAVGNMKVNARGDTIDAQGRIIEPVTEKVSKQYGKTVGNKSAMPVTTRPQQTKPKENIDKDLQALEEEFNDESALEIEQIKEQEKQKAKK